jgi:salicylate hydroxylase
VKNHAAVIGGGIAGLCAALGLARIGWSVTVFEKRHGPSEHGAGIQISANAHKALEWLDVSLEQNAIQPAGLSMFGGSRLGPIAQYAFGNAYKTRFGAPYSVMARSQLQNILWQECESTAGITLKTGNAITAPEDLQQYDMIVGADGIRSEMRRSVAPTATPRATGYTAFRLISDIENAPRAVAQHHSKDDRVSVWFGHQAHAVIYPIAANSLSWVITCRSSVLPDSASSANGWDRLASSQQINKIIDHLPKPLAKLKTLEAAFSVWPVEGVAINASWHGEKMVLIGDAAHAMPPFAAQGGALAMEDAVTLCQSINAQTSLSDAFVDYESKRRVRVEKMRNLAFQNGRIYHLSGPAALARNLALGAMSESLINRRMGWIYDWKP